MRDLVPMESIIGRIVVIRKEKVILDRDLAKLYDVETFNLNKAVKRNIERFPEDFMFQLSENEWENLKFHSGISSSHGGRRTRPYAFTEQGVAMLSSVLRSSRAVQVNIAIMRAFVQMRKILSTHKDLKDKIEAMEKKYDQNFKVVFTAIKELMEPEKPKPMKQIGFEVSEKSS